jgi:hypothetical protein
MPQKTFTPSVSSVRDKSPKLLTNGDFPESDRLGLVSDGFIVLLAVVGLPRFMLYQIVENL